MRKLPRGIRNNNPGNIDYNPANQWEGQVGIERGVSKPRFAEFIDPESGIRAIGKLLLNYHKKGFRTVQQMINRWAPPTENDTGSYVNAVAKSALVEPTQVIDKLSLFILTQMTTAIITHENGYQPYPRDVITRGVARAMQ